MTVAQPATASPSRAARAAGRIQGPASALLLALVTLQVTLAGGAVFGGSSWAVHVMAGMLVVLVALVVAAVALIARPGRLQAGAAIAAFLVAMAQPVTTVLAERVDPAFGLGHGFGAATLVVLASLLLVGQSRRPAPGH